MLTIPYSLTEPAVAAFVWIPLLLACVFVAAVGVAWRRSGATSAQSTRVVVRTALAAAVWMLATWRFADAGLFHRWDRLPPPFGLLVVSVVVLALTIGFSSIGTRISQTLPLWMLVGVQAFRLPLEIAMHAMYERGIMPVQMSYSGRNFDIITGLTAIVVALLVWSGRGGHRLVFAWNVMGAALVLNVVIVAILGTPVFRLFGDDYLNVWVTYTPFVWLPAVMVLAAFAGHLLIFRALRSPARS